MATYAIGDVQGCHGALQRLLHELNYDPVSDRLWFVGDLVNRGPDSLPVMRLVRSLGPGNVCVLGNHDLHLLARRLGVCGDRSSDTLDAVLQAEDCDELLDWLRRLPLMHRDTELDFTLVHAGLYPLWDLAQAERHAVEVCSELQGPDYVSLIQHMYGDQPDCWSDELAGFDRLRFIINCFTRMRFCYPDGRLDLQHTGPPGTQSEELVPWFEYPERRNAQERILFGHWASLRHAGSDNVFALDSGCVWGGRLTALQLDAEPAPRRFSIDCG